LLDQLAAELRPGLEVVREMGDESFGRLFLANETALRRVVVIKVLRQEFVENDEARLRFEREARAAARILHPNVVQVFRVGTLTSGVPFFIEPYVGDRTLQGRLKSVGRFQPAEVRQMLVQLAAALDSAHQTGIVHRDVRPDTVRCEDGTGRLLLTDFGIAGILESAGLDEDTITYPGEILGSAGYMSPEQRDGRPVTDRSDVYSLGVLAWRLLAGLAARVPAVGENTDRAAMLALAPDDPELIDLVARCMREAPEGRPKASEIVRVLDRTASPVGSRSEKSKDGISELWDRLIPYAVIALVGAAITFTGWVMDVFQSPPLVQGLVLTTVIAAVLAAVVSATFHGRRGRQPVTATEIWILVGVGIAWLAAIVFVWLRVAPD
jgi:serine/threonine protein kinase